MFQTVRRLTHPCTALGITTCLLAGTALTRAEPVQLRDSDLTSSASYFESGTASTSLKTNHTSTTGTASTGTFQNQHTGTYAFDLDLLDGQGWKSIQSYCVEIDQYIQFGTQPKDKIGKTYQLVSLGSYAPFSDPGERELTRKLMANAFDDSLTSPTKAAAFQLLMWEIARDSQIDFNQGRFMVSADKFSIGAVNQANQWLDLIDQNVWTKQANVQVLTHPTSQDHIMRVIPLPAALPAGLALTAYAWWRVRRSHNATR